MSSKRAKAEQLSELRSKCLTLDHQVTHQLIILLTKEKSKSIMIVVIRELRVLSKLQKTRFETAKFKCSTKPMKLSNKNRKKTALIL